MHRDYHGEAARALSSVLSICSARAWTPASTASAGPFLVFAPSSRQKEGGDQQHAGQVSETAMGVHRAHLEVVLGGVEAGRVVVPIQPNAPLYHHGRKVELSRPHPDGLQRSIILHRIAGHDTTDPRPPLRVVVNAALRD
jgi:hypothetical protein